MCLLYVRRSVLIDINNTVKSLIVTQPHYLAATAQRGRIPVLHQCQQKGRLPVTGRKLGQVARLAGCQMISECQDAHQHTFTWAVGISVFHWKSGNV